MRNTRSYKHSSTRARKSRRTAGYSKYLKHLRLQQEKPSRELSAAEQEILALIEPGLRTVYVKLVDTLRKQYPLIHFKFRKEDLVVSALSSVDAPILKGPAEVIENTANIFADRLIAKYEKRRPRFNVHGPVPHWVVPPSFWDSETINRIAFYGLNPKDWQDRRTLVVARV